METMHDSDRMVDFATQLSPEQFERFLCQVAARRREAPSPSERESELLLKLSKGIPPQVWNAFEELRQKKEREGLSAEDEKQIAEVIDQIERHLADRVRWAGELAGLRGQSVTELLESLDLGSIA